MGDARKAIANYNSKFNRSIDQLFQTINFGSDLEAGFHGSAASFRASDSPDYVSRVLTQEPVSYIKENPDEVEQLRELHGVGDPTDEQPQIEQTGYVDDFANSVGTSIYNSTVNAVGSYFVGVGVIVLAAVLILGGLIIIAMQSDTVKRVVKTGVDVAV